MGHVQQLGRRGGKWQARVRGADGRERTRLFRRKVDADRWVTTQEADQARGQWVDPALGKMTFSAFAELWEAGLHDLRDSTLDLNLGVCCATICSRGSGRRSSPGSATPT